MRQVNNHSSVTWIEYYLDHKPRIEGLVADRLKSESQRSEPQTAKRPDTSDVTGALSTGPRASREENKVIDLTSPSPPSSPRHTPVVSAARRMYTPSSSASKGRRNAFPAAPRPRCILRSQLETSSQQEVPTPASTLRGNHVKEELVGEEPPRASQSGPIRSGKERRHQASRSPGAVEAARVYSQVRAPVISQFLTLNATQCSPLPERPIARRHSNSPVTGLPPPPTLIVSGGRGNLFTPEDNEYCLLFLRHVLKTQPSCTKASLAAQLGEKVSRATMNSRHESESILVPKMPHHSESSWLNRLYKLPEIDKEIARARRETQAACSSSGHADLSSQDLLVGLVRKRTKHEPKLESISVAPVVTNEAVAARRRPFTEEDKVKLVNYVAHFDSSERIQWKLMCKQVSPATVGIN